MSYLVDTNVFSEPMKARPNKDVVAWLRANEAALYVSTITIEKSVVVLSVCRRDVAKHNCAHGLLRFATA